MNSRPTISSDNRRDVIRARSIKGVLVCSLLLTVSVPAGLFAALPPIPNPILVLTGREYYETGGQQFTRYRYSVFNRKNYPDELFSAAPELPPCGRNTQASRTWIDFYDSRGNRLYGFCAILNSDGLDGLWFALQRDVLPPSWIYIEMTDRKTNTKYKSNLAETTE